MTAQNVDIPKLLKDLAAQPAERRLDFLAQRGDVEPLLLALCDEAELAIRTSVALAVSETACLSELAESAAVSLSIKARVKRARARALSHSGDFEEAISLCRDGIRFANEAGDAVEAGRLNLTAMHSLGELGRFAEAIDCGRSAREVFDRLNLPLLAARADLNLGIIHQRTDDPEDALCYFDRAGKHLKDGSLPEGSLQSNRGEALLALNDFAGAEQAFTSAVRIFEQAGALAHSAITESNLADLATRRGQLQTALTHFERARRLLEQDISVGHLARVLAEQAESMLVLGLTRDAIEQFNEVLPHLEQIGLALEAARARCSLGRALVQAGRFQEAEPVLETASTEFASLGNRTAAARTDIFRAEAALAERDRLKAGALLRNAIDVLHDKPIDAVYAQRLLAHMAIQDGRLAEAEVLLAGAVKTIIGMDHPPLSADLLQLRGSIRRRLGRDREAVDDLRAAIAQIERIRNSLQAERFRTAFLGDRMGAYEDLVGLLLDRDHAEATVEAFDIVERAKSRSLLDMMRGVIDLAFRSHQSASDDSEAALLNDLQRLRAELNALYSRLGDDRGRPGSRREAANWHDLLRRREREFAELESRIATTRGIGSLFAPPVGLKEVQRHLDDAALVIEFFIARDEVLAFVISRDRQHVVRRVFKASELADAIGRLHFQVNRALRPGATDGPRGDRLIGEAVRELSALGESLIQSALKHANGATRLLIVPHGQLHLIPFHALHVDGQPLIERFEVCTCPSLSVLTHLPQDRSGKSRKPRPLVVGVADDFAPRITEEAQSVGELLGTRNGQLLINDQATCEHVCASLPEADLIHIACHGRFSTDVPFGSGLRMSDRWLTVREICGLRLNADLLVLSGCETGRSLVQAGDEMVGLQRSFFVAGVPRMLVSLWRVDDETGTEFMRTFYSSWQSSSEGPVDGLVSRAFRDAVREIRGKKPHPAFWAPFTLVGRP